MKVTIRHNDKPAVLNIQHVAASGASIIFRVNLEEMDFTEGTRIELIVGKSRRITLTEMKDLPGTVGVMVERLDQQGIVIGHEEGGII